jgi:hypothetical protein
MANFIIFSLSALDVTSIWRYSPSAPNSLTALIVSYSPCMSLRVTAKTFAPSLANPSQNALPSPLPAPVTIAARGIIQRVPQELGKAYPENIRGRPPHLPQVPRAGAYHFLHLGSRRHKDDPEATRPLGCQGRHPPRVAKSETLYTEPYIDYSDSQILPSVNVPYVDPVDPRNLVI